MAKKAASAKNSAAGKGQRLLMFTGAECVHCKESYPLVEKLQKEMKVKVDTIEVWHNAENAAWHDSLDKNADGSIFCGGVPFFYNEKTGAKICGTPDYSQLKAWSAAKK